MFDNVVILDNNKDSGWRRLFKFGHFGDILFESVSLEKPIIYSPGKKTIIFLHASNTDVITWYKAVKNNKFEGYLILVRAGGSHTDQARNFAKDQKRIYICEYKPYDFKKYVFQKFMDSIQCPNPDWSLLRKPPFNHRILPSLSVLCHGFLLKLQEDESFLDIFDASWWQVFGNDTYDTIELLVRRECCEKEDILRLVSCIFEGFSKLDRDEAIGIVTNANIAIQSVLYSTDCEA